MNDKIEEFFRASDLKVARQHYEYRSAGVSYTGENTYAILHAPRGDATEAIVLMGAWKTVNGELNRSGVALVLTLARYFKRESCNHCRTSSSDLARVVSLVQGHYICDYSGQ